MVMHQFYLLFNAFYTNDTCIGCGLCINKCTMNNIILGMSKWEVCYRFKELNEI